MASSPKYLTLLFLIFVFSSLQIHARESQFFSKFNQYNPTTNTNAKETQVTQTISPKQADESSLTPETETGYGLYGRGNGEFPTANEASYTFPNLREKNPNAEYNDQSYEYNSNNNFNNHQNLGYETKQYSLSDTTSRGSDNNNNFYYYNNGNQAKQQGTSSTRYQDIGNNYNNNAYQGKQQGMSDTRYQNNGNSYYYSNKNGFQGEKQGMSDTRFLENGKYFYDVNNEYAYQNEYKFRGMDTMNQYNYGSNNGNNANSNEIDNSMELEDENQERP